MDVQAKIRRIPANIISDNKERVEITTDPRYLPGIEQSVGFVIEPMKEEAANSEEERGEATVDVGPVHEPGDVAETEEDLNKENVATDQHIELDQPPDPHHRPHTQRQRGRRGRRGRLRRHTKRHHGGKPRHPQCSPVSRSNHKSSDTTAADKGTTRYGPEGEDPITIPSVLSSTPTLPKYVRPTHYVAE
ncbi:hypothetical protein DAPPUDRAFT_262428 [Daphnia pulex]|uniref:Uncharacterized protein n=1 Tax=Daphnia pulex TaxID=6669 RepID=E9HMZ6_DAPPU|nr:hypothetical protein DAPPUDRAFT_262428 [Daphnia pulex]|eukprot:EFX66902.1 hypothetical protein DAPPUDRAFT_262428 [Daphnia pulex]